MAIKSFSPERDMKGETEGIREQTVSLSIRKTVLIKRGIILSVIW
jgi:hypothetical protein